MRRLIELGVGGSTEILPKELVTVFSRILQFQTTLINIGRVRVSRSIRERVKENTWRYVAYSFLLQKSQA